MANIERQADATWHGTLPQGNGTATLGSGVFGQFPVTWASRTERSDGKTSPEELIAAAQAICFSMALSATLSGEGHTADHVHVRAVCGANLSSAGLKITTMDIYVSGVVPGLDQQGFEAAVQKAEQSCPVANAIRNNVQISVHVTEHSENEEPATT